MRTTSGHGGGLEGSGGYDRRDVARCWAAFASLGAGLIHLAVVREHWAEWWLYGVFFAALGAYQAGWAVAALARSRPPLPRLTAGVNVAVIGLWALSRTTGLPFGPGAGESEPVGVADLLAVVLEVATMLSLLAAVSSRSRPQASAHRSAAGLVALLGAGALAVSAVTTPALAATDAGKHAHAHGSHGSHDDNGHEPPAG